MKYNVNIPTFEGPLDLLLHLIKQNNIDIYDINIDEITIQYLNYIHLMEELNLNIASEYLVMAAELIEIKSSSLLPTEQSADDLFEEDSKENLIEKLLNYEKYKNMSSELKKLEDFRNEVFTREPDSLIKFKDEKDEISIDITLNDLLDAFSNFIKQKELDKPLNTKVTNKEYSVKKRCAEIKNILKQKRKINFSDLFETFSKNYIVVTFLAVLTMTRNQEILIEQDTNFNNIIIKEKVI